jgi:hypothetical protein
LWTCCLLVHCSTHQHMYTTGAESVPPFSRRSASYALLVKTGFKQIVPDVAARWNHAMELGWAQSVHASRAWRSWGSSNAPLSRHVTDETSLTVIYLCYPSPIASLLAIQRPLSLAFCILARRGCLHAAGHFTRLLVISSII